MELKNKKNNYNKVLQIFINNKFLFVSASIALLACIFQFWMAYPGYFNGDTFNLLILKDDAEPIVFYYIFSWIFSIFGVHLWIALLLLIIPFYLGLWVLSWAFYQRYKSWWALLLFFPFFIQNIFVLNFILLSTSFIFGFSFLLYSILFYYILNPKKCKNLFFILTAILMYLLSLFVRHNGIVQVYPACLIVIYMYLRNLHLTKKIFCMKFIFLSMISAILSAIIVCTPAHVLPVGLKVFPAQHILVNQIAAMCVPEDDSSCIDGNWYVEGKGWEDLKRGFNMYPTNANAIAFHPFFDAYTINHIRIEAKGIEKMWLKAIYKYPKNWINHEIELINDIWYKPIDFVEWAPSGPRSPFYESFEFDRKMKEDQYIDIFPQDELYLHETPLKLKLLRIWDDYLPHIPTMFWIGLMRFICILSLGLLLFSVSGELLVYCFIMSLCGLGAAVVYGGFYPEPAPRYMLPIIVYAHLSSIAFVTFLYNRLIYDNSEENKP